jgi:hypothetical protein
MSIESTGSATSVTAVLPIPKEVVTGEIEHSSASVVLHDSNAYNICWGEYHILLFQVF